MCSVNDYHLTKTLRFRKPKKTHYFIKAKRTTSPRSLADKEKSHHHVFMLLNNKGKTHHHQLYTSKENIYHFSLSLITMENSPLLLTDKVSFHLSIMPCNNEIFNVFNANMPYTPCSQTTNENHYQITV